MGTSYWSNCISFFKEGFGHSFLGWQYVALGVLIVVIVIYFPEGIMGWLEKNIQKDLVK